MIVTYTHCGIILEQFEGAVGYDESWPICRKCGHPMMLRTVTGSNITYVEHNATTAPETPGRPAAKGRAGHDL